MSSLQQRRPLQPSPDRRLHRRSTLVLPLRSLLLRLLLLYAMKQRSYDGAVRLQTVVGRQELAESEAGKT